MSWIYDYSFSWLHRICFSILKRGVIPRHIAIIMDGNRRYAKKNKVGNQEGYKKGFDKLAETLQWCLNLEVYEVTVFAFSIGNFKRNKEEVDNLLDLAKEKFKALISEWEKLKEHGIQVRVIGNLKLLPKDIQALIAIAMLITSKNRKAFLNIAFSYTGKEELCDTSEQILKAIQNHELKEADLLGTEFFDDCLYTCNSPHPEVVIRTSGESRISNFLMWQSSHSYLHSVRSMWPEFSVWNLLSAIFCYQHFQKRFENNRLREDFSQNPLNSPKQFSELLESKRFTSLISSALDIGVLSDVNLVTSYSPEQIYQYYRSHIVPFYLLS